MNDWYGFGVIDALIGQGITHGWQYCGKPACRDQYNMGYSHGLVTKQFHEWTEKTETQG